MSKGVIWSIVGVVVVVAAVVLAVIFIPGNSGNKTTIKKTSQNKSLSTAQKTAAINKIKTNFTTFFASSTTMQERESLLQNGSQFAQPMQAEFTQLGSQNPSVTINNVELTDDTTAKVDYTVNLNAQPVLKNQTGEALLINGTWMVSDSTLCQLFSLSGQTPSICNNVH